MKYYLLSIILLLLLYEIEEHLKWFYISYHPLYQVSDCFEYHIKKEENWEEDTNQIYKVKEIGNKSYKVKYIYHSNILEIKFYYALNEHTKKINCPTDLEKE